MKKHFLQKSFKSVFFTFAFLSATLLSMSSNAQCTAAAGTITGNVYEDKNNDGIKDNGENSVANVLVSIYGSNGQLISYQSTSNSGDYSFSGLVDGADYKLTFDYLDKFASSFIGNNSGTDVQFCKSPKCNASLGLVTAQYKCSTNPELFTTCFVQGAVSGTGAHENVETIVGLEHNFGSSSTVQKYATHKETGSVWGLAWKSSTSELFSSAFVKQYAGLTTHGHGAIFKTKVNGSTGTTSKFVTLQELGINVGHLTSNGTASGTPLTIDNCDYGKNVGKAGLGALIIDPSEEFLYVVNLYNKSLVKIPTSNPTTATTKEVTIPNPNCSNGEYAPFALKYFNDKIYIGVTCYEGTNKSQANSSATVYEFDPYTETFTSIFTTNYLKGYWSDVPDDLSLIQHWFTDLDFTDDGNMVLSFSDRVGHRFCKQPNNRLDHQYPDILLAYKDTNGIWQLESNGKVGTLTGTGVGNSQGPGGGEFFGDDYWITQPLYHPEIALGSVFVLPGTNSVVAAAYDPGTNSYSGGFQRYSTTNGQKLGAKELYTRENQILFGKATGFGDIIGRCGLPNIQIGNLVWFDANNNGIQDAGELPINNLTLNLLDKDCNQVATTTTNGNGNFVFSNIAPGVQYYISLPTNVLDVNYNLVSINNANYVFSPLVNGKGNTDSNASITANNCSGSVIPIRSTKTNHTLDIGLSAANGFDLALKNEIVGNDFYRKNDVVDFRITIYNQGSVPAKNIQIINYIPSGLMFNQAINPNWTLSGNNATTTLTNVLLPGASTSVIIKLSLMSNDASQIIDYAEIVSATDHNGVTQTDKDSTPDGIEGNDTGGEINTITDNKLDDSGTIDEDDEDPATPSVVDLALKQTLSSNCINAGDCHSINISVYNQGNTPVSEFKITNYFGNLLTLGSNNPGWTLEAGKLYYTASEIMPGEVKSIPLSICIKEGVLNTNITNYAEISEIKVDGAVTTKDYDSNPDEITNNDAGGTPATSEDDYVNGGLSTEEDDHDPVYLTISYVDLALKLTTNKRKVVNGESVCFTATIYNQGNETVKEVDIVDYIPENLELTDNNWTKIGNIANRKITFPNGFAPGEEYSTDICFKVINFTNKYYIENVAEINGGLNMCNQSIATKDIDSEADQIASNDLGGRPGTDTDNIVNGLPSVDEDDQDPAMLINFDTNSGVCVCEANATNSTNGQFSQTVSIRGPKGMTWFIDQVNNFYSTTSALPPATPTPFIIGAAGIVLTEVPVNTTTSDYKLTGIYEEGKNFMLVLKSSQDDFATINSGGCSYSPVEVKGTNSLCTASPQEYSVPVAAGGYSVTLSGGGTITASNADSSKITVLWGNVAGVYTLTFENKNTTLCNEPGILDVAIGSPLTSLACKSNIQVSMDSDCSITVTPGMIAAGPTPPGAPLVVMLTDVKGKNIPNAILNQDHIGKMITVKMIEGCSGNSCWGKITVEDKTGPTITCTDTVEVSCFKADSYPGPLSQDNCTPTKLTLLDSAATTLFCNPNYNMFINKKYVATDKFGNKSAVCNQVIAVKRIEMDSVKFPVDIEMANALTCNNYAKDEFGMPAPSVTGAPTIEGESIYPAFDKACNIGVAYVDRDFGFIGCARKIMRVWTVYEAWCTQGVIRKDTQTIIIADIKKPIFTCPDTMRVSASIGTCEANVTLPRITNIKDDCATTFVVDVKYPGGFFANTTGNVRLSRGNNRITYIVYDECLNHDSCSMIVKVEDKTPPTVVCDQSTTVGITSLGEGYIYASTINDGSYDACGIDSMRVRRLDVQNALFANTVSFGCPDVNKTIMVELKVWDLEGNANSCMVNVLVQDKTLPKITCPPNVTISCEVDIDPKNLPVATYGYATAEDVCGAIVTDTVTANIDQCRIGTIRRVFTARDGNGFVRCTSYIEIERQNTNLNIKWPEDFTTSNGCTPADLDPSKLPAKNARPSFNDGICDLVAASFEDDYYEIDGSGQACFKIVRTWTVIDWCRKNDTLYEPEVYQQLIKVTNNVDPSIGLDVQDTICTQNNNCDEGFITLKADGFDDCTPRKNLSWKYQIDLNYNGTFTPEITNIGRGEKMDASGVYDVGSHRILFTFEDRCGNQVTQFHDFVVKNCVAPTPVCINGTSISLGQMSINGQLIRMACIPAKSLNVSSSHPCGYDLKYSFSTNTNDTTKCFNCMDIGRRNITLYVTDEFGNYSSCTTFIDVQNNDPSQISITATKETTCAGESITLTAVGTGTILWSTGATTRTITVSPTTTTTYALSVTSTDQCTLMASKEIVVNPLPTIQIASNLANNGSAVCAGQPITLTASGGSTYRWNTTPNKTTVSITENPTANTNYIVTVTTAAGCSATANRNISINVLPTPTIQAGAATICAGQSTTLSVTALAPGSYTYNWNTTPPQTGATATVNPTTTTTYTVTVTNGLGCSATTTATVTVNPVPTPTIAGPNTSCSGSPITLSTSGGGTYAWNVPPVNNTASINVSPTATTTYRVTVTNTQGCTASATKEVVINPLPNITIAGPTSSCINTPVTWTASGGATYSWNTTPPQNTAAITFTPTNGGNTTYTVTVTSSQGCSATSSRTVFVSPNLTFNVNANPTAVCVGGSTTISTTFQGTGASYLWNTNPVQTTATIIVSPSVATTYSVTITGSNTCTGTGSVNVAVNSLPNASISGTNTICAGQSTTLTATGGTSYSWNTTPAQTTAAINVSPSATTTYTVTVTNANGCTATATRTVIVNPLPTAAIAGPTATCVSTPVTLTASGGGTYNWNTTPAQTTAAISVTPTAPSTTYIVTVTGGAGCSATASQTVTVNPNLNVIVSGTPNGICVGGSSVISTNITGANYTWNTNPPQTTPTITVSPAATTTYSVTVTGGANGCSGTGSYTLNVTNPPVVNITGTNTICAGQSTTLTATGGGTYSWNTTPAQTTAAITVSPSVTTTYVVTVTNSQGCSVTASRTVTVNPLPQPSITGNLTICDGQSTTLTATGGGTYSWNTNPVQTTAAITVNPTTTTTYTVVVTNANGCTASASATVTVNPKPTINITGNTTICAGQSTILTASGGTAYSWNTTPPTNTAALTVTPTATTTYVVTVTGANGCTNTASVTVTVNPKPIANITGDLNICLGESTTLTASGGGTYIWNTTPPQTSASITVSPTTTTSYTVTVTSANTCTSTATATVTVNPNNTPIANCRNLTVFLNSQGTISITGAQVNNNSVPGCDNAALSFSVTPNTFFCNDIGSSPLTVVLTVTSASGPTATCTSQVTVRDTLDPVISCPANLTINCANFAGLSGLAIATATDNCPPPVITSVTLNATNVCSIGTITRTFTARDASNNTAECSQLITITPSTDPLTPSDITFPPNVNLTSCSSTAPSVTGNVVVNTQNATCTKISTGFTDVNSGPPCNFTITRTWRVVDSCQLNPNNPTAGIFTGTQLINVVDNQAPVISGYADVTVSTAVCPVLVNYNMTNVSITDCSTLTITNNSPTATNPNTGNPSGLYEEGVHTIIITAMDQCGFMTKDTITITVILTTNVEFVVCQKIIRNITPQDFVDVKAKEFILAIQGTCSPEDHMYSYSRTMVNDTVRRYPCDSLGDRRVFVYHYKNGVLIDSCKSIVTILDPSNFCTGNIFRIAGEINTENFVPVKDVEIYLGNGMTKVMTDENGKYALPPMVPNGNYMLSPRKEDGILEGVSTLDLIMIQRHILGSAKLTSPYRMIAADINNDNKITASDLVELRKVLVGINNTFKNNTSWKTIDSGYKFPDPSNPFNSAYPLYHEFLQPSGQQIADFIGVKIGDVNISYVAQANNSISSNKITLEASNEFVEKGKEVSIDYRINTTNPLDGAQLVFDVTYLENVDVVSNILTYSQYEFNRKGNKLYITITPDFIIKNNSEALFTVIGNAAENGYKSDLVKLTTDKLQNEAYVNLKATPLEQAWIESREFTVDQNSPNPWNEMTTIKFNVPKDGQVKFVLTDVKGARILNQNIPVSKGQNSIQLSSDVIGTETGVFFYEISFNGKSQHGKMIRIQ